MSPQENIKLWACLPLPFEEVRIEQGLYLASKLPKLKTILCQCQQHRRVAFAKRGNSQLAMHHTNQVTLSRRCTRSTEARVDWDKGIHSTALSSVPLRLRKGSLFCALVFEGCFITSLGWASLRKMTLSTKQTMRSSLESLNPWVLKRKPRRLKMSPSQPNLTSLPTGSLMQSIHLYRSTSVRWLHVCSPLLKGAVGTFGFWFANSTPFCCMGFWPSIWTNPVWICLGEYCGKVIVSLRWHQGLRCKGSRLLSLRRLNFTNNIMLTRFGWSFKECSFDCHYDCAPVAPKNCLSLHDEAPLRPDILQPHAFIEKHFGSHTFCNVCRKMLYGVGKQGFACSSMIETRLQTNYFFISFLNLKGLKLTICYKWMSSMSICFSWGVFAESPNQLSATKAGCALERSIASLLGGR